MGRADRRQQILTAARRLLDGAPGGRGVSVERVAEAARVSRATVYRYFPGPGALLAALGTVEGPDRAPRDPRAQILEAALAVFLERGVHATTLRQIADRAGLSLSGLHWHFKNKDD